MFPEGESAAAEAPLRRVVDLLDDESGRRRTILTSALATGTAGCGVALLATSAWLISRAAQHPSVVALGLAIVGVRFFAVARGLCRYGERLSGHDAALRVLASLRVRVYDRLEALAPSGLPAFRNGDLLARLVHDVDALQDLMVKVVPPFAASLAVGAAAVVATWLILPPAGVVLGVMLLVAVFGIPRYTRSMAARREARMAAARGELATRVVDLVQGAQELVAFGATDAQLARLSESDAELTRIAYSSARTSGTGSGLATLLTGAAVFAMLMIGVPAVHSGRLPGVLLAVLALIPLATFEMVAGLPAASQSLEGVRQSAKRIVEVTDAQPLVQEPEVPRQVPAGPRQVVVRGLRARYGDRDHWALDGIDLDLSPGTRVAIIGPSGAGKSTLASVLLRFLPYEGSATLDGVELSELPGDEVRRVIGLCAQETHVFATTLRENLLLARRDADERALRGALSQVRLDEWVDSLPDGLGTEVGGHGDRMSGGQRQRLGIARGLLAGFPILVLDEPTEHLDEATADALVEDLIDITRCHTTVMITHRLSRLAAMDEILVLDGGRVVARGTHAELLAAGGYYARQFELESEILGVRGGVG
jgi:thiol reductant ABC exporter CydC subunit